MGYQYSTRIGYHEVGRDRQLTLPALVDLFQDVGGFHGADCGYSNQALAEKGLAWIVSSWQVRTRCLPQLDGHVVLETCPFSFKYCLANRQYALTSPDGKAFVHANSVWILMDMEKYAPVKIPPEMQEAYGVCEDITAGEDFGGRKISALSGGIPQEPIHVDRYMIDTNGHVNNKEYVRLACCLVPDAPETGLFRAEYTKQAREGDRMLPFVSREDDRIVLTLNNKDGEQFFICEWRA